MTVHGPAGGGFVGLSVAATLVAAGFAVTFTTCVVVIAVLTYPAVIAGEYA